MKMRNGLAKMFHRLGDVFSQGYDAGDRSSRYRKDLGWDRRTPRDEDSMLKDGSRELIRQRCANLRRNNAVVAGVCNRIASFVVGGGIIPQARTSDNAWNKAAEQWWREWSARCDVRGRQNLRQIQWMASGLRPSHGGLYIQLLKSGQIRPIETERIRDPQDIKQREGVIEGVKIDPTSGEALKYCVHTRDKGGAFTQKHNETWISADDVLPVITPAWRPDQVREIPDLAPVVPHLQDIHEMNQHTLNTAKAQSMVLGFLKKQGGMGLNSLPRGSNVASPSVGARQTFQFDWGQMLEGFPGDDLDMKVSPTPNAQHIPYMQMQLGLCAAALDFPYEFFTLDFSKCDYSRFKGVLLWVNKTCRPWRTWLNDSLNQRIWNWRIAMAIGDGELDPAPVDKRGVSEWMHVEWQAPEEPWVDRQEANQADMMEWQLGLGTVSEFAKRRGKDLEEVLREKAANIQLSHKIEKEFDLPIGTLIKAQIPGQTETPQNATPAPDDKKPVEDKEDGIQK
jgi:lambda family phage portal protein